MLRMFNAFAAVVMAIRTTCLGMEGVFFSGFKAALLYKVTQLWELKEAKDSVGALRLQPEQMCAGLQAEY